MGALIPKQVTESDLSLLLAKAGFIRTHQGKVRDSYELPGHKDLILILATDRLSTFDFVLPSLVKDKGKVLTALTIFWLTKVLKGVKHHLIESGSKIDKYLPTILHNNPELQTRALVVKRLEMLPIECIVRGYLTGSGWAAYQKEKAVCGIKLPEGLYDGAKLSSPIFTPSTKAEAGHDEHITASSVLEKYGPSLDKLTLEIYNQILDYSLAKGVIIADTKFEFGEGFILGDEIGTPDSSRFWGEEEWKEMKSEKRSPTNYDKQLVRDWGKTVETPFDGLIGIDKLDPENAEHIDFIQRLKVPNSVLKETSLRYRHIFSRLTGLKLKTFQKSEMGI